MSFEAPQKGNPHGITVKQHTFPSASIARFTNEKGSVQVMRKQAGQVFHVKPADQVFCAQRLWDQQAEGVFMKDIEDAFQELASTTLDRPSFQLGPQHFTLINEFYCLWNIRVIRKMNGYQADASIAGPNVTAVLYEYTTDDQEQLDAGYLGYVRPDLTIPGRSLLGSLIGLEHRKAVRMMRDVSWELLQTVDAELLVPDNFFDLYVVPLSPTACLAAQGVIPGGRLTRQAVTALNRAAVATSVDYYFGRDLSMCPR